MTMEEILTRLGNMEDEIRDIKLRLNKLLAHDETGNLVFGGVLKSNMISGGMTGVPLIFTADTIFQLLVPQWVQRIQRSILRVRFTGSMTLANLSIDGINRTSLLAGPWSSVTDIDILPYLVDVRNIPVLGDHPITLDVSGAGSIQITPDLYFVSKPGFSF